MRKLLLFAIILIAIESDAQGPMLIPYQAVARNNSGDLITDQNISLRISIHDGSAAGAVFPAQWDPKLGIHVT